MEAVRTLTDREAAFARNYHREDPTSAIAVYWRRHRLLAEEFDAAEEAEDFLDVGEDNGALAGVAVVAPDGSLTVRP